MDQPVKILLQKKPSKDKELNAKNVKIAAQSGSPPIVSGKEIEAFQKLFSRFDMELSLRYYFNILEFHHKYPFQELESFDPKVFPAQNPSTLAIGIIGRSGVGKTSFISNLINYLIPPEKAAPVLKKPIQGIDLYAADSMLFLDSFPLFHYPERLLKKGFTKESINSWVNKMVVFLLSTCQVVIVMIDKRKDLEVVEYLKKIQAIRKDFFKRSKENRSDDEVDQDPHIIFVYNKCKPDHYSLPAFEGSKKMIQSVLKNSHLKYSYSISSQRLAQPLLSDEHIQISPVNFYALPYDNAKNLKELDHEVKVGGILKPSVLSKYWSVPASYPIALKELLHNLKLIPNFSNKSLNCLSYREWHQKAVESWNSIGQFDFKL